GSAAPAAPEGPASAPAMPPRPWQDGIGPAFISLFLLIAFFDQLAPHTLARGGLGPSVAGAAAGGGLAFALLYYAPAMWGLRSRRGLVEIAGRTFGRDGARWVPGVTLALVQAAWFAVAIGYAAGLSLKA